MKQRDEREFSEHIAAVADVMAAEAEADGDYERAAALRAMSDAARRKSEERDVAATR